MPKFDVYMTRRVTEYVTVSVDAPDEFAAAEAALEGADSAEWSTDYDDAWPAEVCAIDACGMTDDEVRERILAASLKLDPHRQGDCWPDPIAWDGRPLDEQLADLEVLLAAQEGR